MAGKPLRGRNQWPEGHERMRAAMLRYLKALEGVGERMLPVLARSLDMPAGHFAPFFANEAHINLRFLHYPPQDTDDDEQFGQGPHTDNSFITMLAREDVPGLAVRLPSGEWLAPPVIPGTFLVNLGNMMKRWSNDRFLSTPHGVLNDSGTDRYSIAFFYSPNPASTIECLPSCTGPGDPPRYPPAVYRDLVLDFYNANYFHRKDYGGGEQVERNNPPHLYFPAKIGGRRKGLRKAGRFRRFLLQLLGRTGVTGGFPAKCAFRFSRINAVAAARDSGARAETCGVIITLSNCSSSGSFGGSAGSPSRTSRPAPPMRFPRRASRSASVSTTVPRPTLTT